MDNCGYTINIDGQVREFQGEEELHAFLRENKKSLKASLLTDKPMFSLGKDKQSLTDDLITSISDKVDFDKEDHKLRVGERNYTPVTKYISEQKLVPEFRMQEWEDRTRIALGKEINVDGTPKYSDSQKDDIVSQIKHQWETSSLVGTSWHDIADGFFKGTISTPEDILTQFPQLKDRDYVLKKYISSLSDLKSQLLRKHGADAIFRSEAKIFDDDSGVAGVSDLIVIDKKGKAHIYDYKTSDKDEISWHQSKEITIDYQLGMYKQMLRRNNVDVDSINIIPVSLRDIDWESRVVNDFDIQPSKTLYLADGERIMLNINRLLPYNLTMKLSEVTDNKPIYSFLKDAFNYEPASHTLPDPLTVDEEFTKLKANTTPTDYSYRLHNPIDPSRPLYIPKKIGEEAVKKQLASYLQQFNQYQRILPLRFYDFVTYAKNQIERGEVVNWEKRWSKQAGTVNKMSTLLSKYIMDPAWQPLQSDALYDLNTVGFENKETNQVDLISLSADNLDISPKLLQDKGKASTVLGNYVSDSKAKFEKIPHKVVNGDVELLKLVAFIKANKDIFSEKRIGQLTAVNILKGNVVPRMYTQTLDSLSTQWDTLMKYAPDTLDFKKDNWKIQGIDYTDAFIQDMQSMFEKKDFSPLDYQRTKGAFERLMSATEKAEKIQHLGRIADNLSRSIDYDPAVGVHRQADQTRLLYLASQAILQLEELPVIREADMKQYANILKENINFSSPNSIANQAYKNITKLTGIALSNTTHRFNEYKAKVRDINARLYEAQGSILGVKVIGNNLPVFRNLFETEDNTPTGRKTMRLKDPNHPSLQPAEKQYILDYMELLGQVREAKLQPGEVLTSEHARNIPLMRASELTAFRNANYKDWFKNYFRDILNPNNVYDNDVTSQELLAKQSRMFNFFDHYDINLEARQEKLAASDPNEFEHDLEAVMDMYFMMHSKESEMNKIMPAINAQKMITMLSGEFQYESNANTAKGINDYIGTVLFDKNLIAGESKGMAITAQIFKDLTSKAMMVGSPIAGEVEFFNGWFNNITRATANRYDPTLFTSKELFKAGQFVFADVPNQNLSFDKVNLTDNINEMFRVADMNLKELVHKVQTTSSGVTKFNSHWAYWLQSFPTYTNRMTMFMAQMMHDGIFKTTALGGIATDSALQMVKGDLVYNPKLDDRFKEYLAKPDLAEHLQSPEWKKSRALYTVLKDALTQEPGGLTDKGEIARPYDNATRDSMKTRADDVHGNYDKDTKTRIEQLAFTKMLFQFKTYLSAKKNRWYTETTYDERRGHWVTEEHDGVPIAMWKGRVNEGIWQTLCALTNEVKNNSGNVIKAWDGMASVQKQNLHLMTMDILQFGLYTMLLGLLGYGAAANKDQKKPEGVEGEALRGLYNAAGDLWIGNSAAALIGSRNPISSLAWATNVANGTWGVLTGKPNAATDLANNVSVFRTINKITK